VVSSEFAHEHCYVPSERVRVLLEDIAQTTLFSPGEPPAERSLTIFKFLVEQIGREKATFKGGFDLPLLALCEEDELQQKLVGRTVSCPNERRSGSDGDFVTLRDGRVIPRSDMR
jgi:hypothetical protein